MRRRSRAATGFTLIEVALALGVMAFCLVALLALLPIGLKLNQTSIENTAITSATAAIMADLFATPLTASQSPRFNFKVPAPGAPATPAAAPQTLFLPASGDSDGSVALKAGASPVFTGASQTQSRYRACVWFTPPTDAKSKAATLVHILVTWPAIADQQPSTVPKNYTGSFETVTALNRN